MTKIDERDGAQCSKAKPKKRPWLVSFFGALFFFHGSFAGLSLLIWLFLPSSYEIDYFDGPVPIGEVRFRVLGMFALWAIFATYVGWGLLKGNPIARHIIFVAFLVSGLLSFLRSEQLLTLGVTIYLGVLFGLYLYQKPNVKEFFGTYEQDKRPKT